MAIASKDCIDVKQLPTCYMSFKCVMKLTMSAPRYRHIPICILHNCLDNTLEYINFFCKFS